MQLSLPRSQPRRATKWQHLYLNYQDTILFSLRPTALRRTENLRC